MLTALRPGVQIGLGFAVCLLTATAANAHPYGLSSTNRLIAIEPHARALRVAFVLDFAELPTTQELRELDADHDGQVTERERETYLDGLMARMIANWRLRLDGQALTAVVRSRSLEVAEGEARLHTLRVTAEVTVQLHSAANSLTDHHLDVSDLSYSDRPGWREIRVESGFAFDVQALHSGDAGTALSRDGRTLLRMNEGHFVLRARAATAAARGHSGEVPRGARAAPVRWILAGLACLVGLLAWARARRPSN
ncbi:MAG: hypothetical protein Q8Q09_13485 [Deltaproteobacteria bacterium]|nr:hypothetical protein [Deltaproteobacteria bacterium]